LVEERQVASPRQINCNGDRKASSDDNCNSNGKSNSKSKSLDADRTDQHRRSVDDGVNASFGSTAWISGMTA
jgi:hypothetical protein